MALSTATPAGMLARRWRRLRSLPGGSWFFSRMLGWAVPYSGTIAPRVLSLEAGHARVAMPDRRRVRNHLRSIHAIALCNLGELTSGLALTAALPRDTRGIVTSLSTDYLKKARGVVIAECRCTVPDHITEPVVRVVEAEIRDADHDLVARTTVHWRLAPA